MRPHFFPRGLHPASAACHFGVPAFSGLSKSIDQRDRFQTFFVLPLLPLFLNEARILNLQVAGASVDLAQVRHEYEITVNVSRKKGDIEIVAVM